MAEVTDLEAQRMISDAIALERACRVLLRRWPGSHEAASAASAWKFLAEMLRKAAEQHGEPA
jgi:hypothetical protein